MLSPKTNVGKLRNDLLMTLFAYFQNGRQKSWNLTYYWNNLFFLNVFIQNHLYYVLRLFFQLEYMALTAIYIVIPGYYRIHGNKCPFSLKKLDISLPYSVSCYFQMLVLFIERFWTVYQLFK